MRELIMSDAFTKMDTMYRYQRYIYDPTRRFYLLGRNRMLDLMQVRDGDNVLEVGCGTGRNLAILARRHPKASFYGLDASAAMLESAKKKTDLENVRLEVALAQKFDHAETFGLAKPFDIIYFSYSISMIPVWREALSKALENLRPGGVIYIVDFYDQKRLPSSFRAILKLWLRQFHVRYWKDLLPYLSRLEEHNFGMLDITPVARRYAFIARFQKSGTARAASVTTAAETLT
jgi:S-adenosylmethionine-diacylgycerolhomoserine-N-methlytransferase